MKQNLSAEGAIESWISASEEALWNAKFVNIDYNPKTLHLSGDIGRKGSIGIDFSIQSDGRTRLEITATDTDLLNLFKREVTKTFLHHQQEEKSIDHKDTASAPEDRYQTDYSDENDEMTDTFHDYDESSETAYEDPWAIRDINGRFQIPPALRNAQCYHKVWFIVLMLIVFPPLGIFLMYYYRRFRIFPRIVVTIVAFLYTVLIWVGIFGVNTGFNQENLNKWYTQQRSQIIRMFNLNTVETPRPAESSNNETNDS